MKLIRLAADGDIEKLSYSQTKHCLDRFTIGDGDHPTLRFLFQELAQDKCAVARGAATNVVTHVH